MCDSANQGSYGSFGRNANGDNYKDDQIPLLPISTNSSSNYNSVSSPSSQFHSEYIDPYYSHSSYLSPSVIRRRFGDSFGSKSKYCLPIVIILFCLFGVVGYFCYSNYSTAIIKSSGDTYVIYILRHAEMKNVTPYEVE